MYQFDIEQPQPCIQMRSNSRCPYAVHTYKRGQPQLQLLCSRCTNSERVQQFGFSRGLLALYTILCVCTSSSSSNNTARARSLCVYMCGGYYYCWYNSAAAPLFNPFVQIQQNAPSVVPACVRERTLGGETKRDDFQGVNVNTFIRSQMSALKRKCTFGSWLAWCDAEIWSLKLRIFSYSKIVI